MMQSVVFAGLLALAVAIPLPQTEYDPSMYTVIYDTPEGRHLQMGEPGKAVTGFYESRSLDGAMVYKTIYEADDKGFRARGEHLPLAPVANQVQARSDDAPVYVFKYDAEGSHTHYQMGEPGKAVQGSYMYYDPQGRAMTVNYVADENGYRVTDVVAAPVTVDDESVVIAVADAPVAEAPVVVAEVPAVAEVSAEPTAVAEEAPAADPVPVVAEAIAVAEVSAEPAVVAEEAPAAVESIAVAEVSAEPTAVAEEAPAAEPAVVAEEAPAAVEAVAVAEVSAEPAVVVEEAPAADPVPIDAETPVTVVAESPAEIAAAPEETPTAVLVADEASVADLAVSDEIFPAEVATVVAVETAASVSTSDDDAHNGAAIRFFTIPVSVRPYPYVYSFHGALPYAASYGYGYSYNMGYPFSAVYAY